MSRALTPRILMKGVNISLLLRDLFARLLQAFRHLDRCLKYNR